MKATFVLSLLLVSSLSSLAFAQAPPAAAAPDPAAPAASPPPAASSPPAPTEATPEPQAAPVQGQEQPPPPTYQAEPQEPPPVVLGESAEPSEQPKPRSAGPFSRGSVSISLLVGSAFSNDKSYMILGGGVGYYLVDGLEAGLEGQIWLFDEPTIGTVTPQIRYVLHMVPVIKPYIGTFYRRYLIGNDRDDFSSVGARAGGILMLGGGRTFIGIGALYEHIIEDSEVLASDEWYPELSVGISL